MGTLARRLLPIVTTGLTSLVLLVRNTFWHGFRHANTDAQTVIVMFALVGFMLHGALAGLAVWAIGVLGAVLAYTVADSLND